MEIKCLDTILDEYAVNSGYADWCDMFYSEAVEIGTKGIYEIANAYASQFKELNEEFAEKARLFALQSKQQNKELEDRVKELECMIVAARDVISKRMCKTIDSREFMLLDNIYQESNSIINKGK